MAPRASQVEGALPGFGSWSYKESLVLTPRLANEPPGCHSVHWENVIPGTMTALS